MSPPEKDAGAMCQEILRDKESVLAVRPKEWRSESWSEQGLKSELS